VRLANQKSEVGGLQENSLEFRDKPPLTELRSLAERPNYVKTDRDDLTETVLRTLYSSLDDMGSVTPCATLPSYVARERSIAGRDDRAGMHLRRS